MTESERRIYHPIQDDYATFLKLAEETGGELSLLRVELAPGGSGQLHYHRQFSERFEAVEGELTVKLASGEKRLKPGESYTVAPGELHTFTNPTEKPVTFLVELRPGHSGFEQALMIGYGLARDGLANAKGLPKSLTHTALLVEMSDSNLPGALSLLRPLLRYLAAQARHRGLDRELIARYSISATSHTAQ
jgi:mannose-6-phosphate isomerase-like protein (cupin superfamily)